MVGTLPPLKGNAYYCMSLSREMSKHIVTEFISFKRLYPEFLYPGGVEDDDIALLFAGSAEGRFTNLWRGQAFLMENRHVQLATEHLQLLDGRGPLQVSSDEHRPLLFSFTEVTGQLAAGGGLSCATFLIKNRNTTHSTLTFINR